MSVQSPRRPDRGQGAESTSVGARGADYPRNSSGQGEPSGRSHKKSRRRRDGSPKKSPASSQQGPSTSQPYSRLGNGTLSTSSTSLGEGNATSGDVSAQRSDGSHVAKPKSLRTRISRAVCHPTFLLCAGVPMLVPSAILTGILFAFQSFSALHMVALLLMTLSLACIALACFILCWIYRHRPPSGRQLREKTSKTIGVHVEAGISVQAKSGVKRSTSASDRAGRSDAVAGTSTMYSETDSRKRKMQYKKTKRNSKTIAQLGRITEAAQEEEAVHSRPTHSAHTTAWEERPPRPTSSRQGSGKKSRPPSKDSPPPKAPSIPLICLPRALAIATPDSTVEEDRWQNTSGGSSTARLTRRRSLSDLTDRDRLVEEYLHALAAMESPPDPPGGTPELELVPADSYKEKKRRGHARSKSHGKMASRGFTIDFDPKGSQA